MRKKELRRKLNDELEANQSERLRRTQEKSNKAKPKRVNEQQQSSENKNFEKSLKKS